jgi:single-strand DNA-binding protein
MSGINKVILIGRLGQAPELKHTPSGSAVCNFSLATSESWVDKTTNEKKEKTEWHRIVVWGKLAELCNQYLSVGKECYVEGKLETRTWDNKEGTKMYTTEIKASNVTFLGGAGDKPNTDGVGYAKKDSAPTINAESLPF